MPEVLIISHVMSEATDKVKNIYINPKIRRIVEDI